MSDYQCNLPPTPAWKVRTVIGILVGFALLLLLTGYVVVYRQYQPFFLDGGHWVCTARRNAPTEPDGSISLVKARCTRYELRE